MAISQLGGSTSDNWELISSVTPTAASASVNFTGLTLYRKLLLIWDDVTLGSSGSVSVRLNNDSSSNYAYSFLSYVSTPTYANTFTIFDTEIDCSTSGTSPQGMIQFENCDQTGLKTISNATWSGAAAGTSVNAAGYGYYKGSAVITQVNLITSTTFNAAGTVYLYGVK
jgi:hypothetical protein